MASNIVSTLDKMMRHHEIELVEANDLDDGTKELVYELQTMLDGYPSSESTNCPLNRAQMRYAGGQEKSRLESFSWKR
jgi:hypothetical protein